MVKEKRPTLVFVCETKTRSYKIAGLQRRLDMEGCLVVDSVGRKGGLVFFWKKESGVKVINNSNWHISVHVTGDRREIDWTFTSFYGNSETGRICLFWDLLRKLRVKLICLETLMKFFGRRRR